MPKKTNELGQRRKKGADKRRRTYELYGKCRPTRAGEYTTHGVGGARAATSAPAASPAAGKRKNTKKGGHRG